MSTNRLEGRVLEDFGPECIEGEPFSAEDVSKVEKFNDNVIELVEAAANDDAPKDAIVVCLLERAMDLSHYMYGQHRAKNLSLQILEDMQNRYDVQRN